MLVFVSFSLSSGGAERVICRMANHWAAAEKEVTIVTIAPASHDFYELHPRVRRIALNLAASSLSPFAAVWNNIARVRALRAAIRRLRPSVVISFIDKTNVLTLLATRNLQVPVVVSERIDPRHHRIGPLWERLRRWAYPWADALVIQSKSIAPWANTLVNAERIAVVPNPAPAIAGDLIAQSLPAARKPFVLGMGRLDPQKGFDLLLKAFALATRSRPEWNLIILGEGPERQPLETQARQLGIADRVQLAGSVKNPSTVLREAALFVLSSRYEGFPNALIEAMAHGLPVISFDCPSGPADIITHDHDGILVPAGDTTALSDAMSELLSDGTTRRRLGRCAVAVSDRFRLSRIMQQWEDVIGKAAGNVLLKGDGIAAKQ